MKVKLSTGEVRDFPDGMTGEQIIAQLQKEKAADKSAQPTEGFDWSKLNRPGLLERKIGGLGLNLAKDALYGMAEGGRQIGNIPHKMFPSYPEIEPLGDVFGEKPTGLFHQLVQDTAQYAPAIAAMPAAEMVPALRGAMGLAKQIPKVGGYLSEVIGGHTLPFAAYSAMQAEKDPGKNALMAAGIMESLGLAGKGAASFAKAKPETAQRLKELVSGALGGLAGSPLGTTGAAIGAGLGYSGAKMSKGAQAARKAALFEGANLESPEVIERLAAAKRIGIELTPGEATRDVALRARSGELGRTAESFMTKQDMLQARQDKIRAHAEDLFEKVYDPATEGPSKQALYEQVHKSHIPQELARELAKDPVVASAMKAVRKDPQALRRMQKAGLNLDEFFPPKKEADAIAAELPTHGVYWDSVKRNIQKDIDFITEHKGDTFEADEARRKLLSSIDPVIPEYPKAREISEREIQRRKFEGKFDKKDISSVPISKMMESKSAFDEMLFHTRNVPEAKQALHDMRLLYKDLTPAATGREAEKLATTGMYQDRSSASHAGHQIMKFIDELFTNNKSEIDLVKMLHSGEWKGELRRLAQMKASPSRTKQTIKAFSALIPKKHLPKVLAAYIKEDL